MILNSLSDLAKVSRTIFEDDFGEKQREELKGLERLLDGLSEIDGLKGYPEVDIRQIAFKLYSHGLGNFQRIDEMLRTNIGDSNKEVVQYLSEFSQYLERSNNSLEDGLGLFLIANYMYRGVCRRQEEIEAEGKIIMGDLKRVFDIADDKIRDYENKRSIKAFNFLQQFSPISKLVSGIRERWIFGEDNKEYERLIEQRKFVKGRIHRRIGRIKNLKEYYFNPIKVRLAITISDIVKRIDPLGEGSFRDIGLSRVLRKRVVDLERETLDYTLNNKFGIFAHIIYRYGLVLDDSPEKLRVLEDGFAHLQKCEESNPILSNGYELSIFALKYKQKREIDFDLLSRLNDDLRASIESIRRGATGGDLQILAHLLNTRFSHLNNLLAYDLIDEDREKLREYCLDENISFRRLYRSLHTFALSSNDIPEKYKNQYRSSCSFAGI